MEQHKISLQGRMILMQNVSPKEVSFKVLDGLDKYHGHDVFIGIITYKDLIENCMFLPEVQRQTDPERVKQIAKVIIDQAELKEATRKTNNVIVGTLSDSAQYRKHELTVDFSQDKISINDGSHRTQGVILAVEMLKKKIDKASEEDAIILEGQLNKLYSRKFVIQFFIGLSLDEQRRLFLDTNQGAKQVANSKVVDFDTYSPISKLANFIASLDYIKAMGVETETDHKTKGKAFVKSSLSQTISIILMNTDKFQEVKYVEGYDMAKDLIESIFEILFCEDGVLEKRYFYNKDYLLSSPSTLKAIGSYVNYVRSKYPENWKQYVRALKNIDWSNNHSDWRQIAEARGGQSTIRTVFNVLVEKLC